MNKYRILRTHNICGEVVYVPQYLHHGWLLGDRWKSWDVILFGGSHQLELHKLEDAKKELKQLRYHDETADTVILEEP